MCCMRLTENTGRKKSPFWHHRTTLSACIFAAKPCINNRKNFLNIDTSSTHPHNMANFGLLIAEICWRDLGHPCKFQRVWRLGSITARHSSSGTHYIIYIFIHQTGSTINKTNKYSNLKKTTRMWANALPDGRPVEHRWRPLFNAAKFGSRPLLDAVQ